jgi:hypothetical protein
MEALKKSLKSKGAAVTPIRAPANSNKRKHVR